MSLERSEVYDWQTSWTLTGVYLISNPSVQENFFMIELGANSQHIVIKLPRADLTRRHDT